MTKQIPLVELKDKFALIDDDNYEWVSAYVWHAEPVGNTYYAYREENGIRIYMHDEIMARSKSGHVNTLRAN